MSITFQNTAALFFVPKIQRSVAIYRLVSEINIESLITKFARYLQVGARRKTTKSNLHIHMRPRPKNFGKGYIHNNTAYTTNSRTAEVISSKHRTGENM
ncbi:MAG TPA: hypothetical protein VM368_02425 [Flavisolibacter sp.]|nr:hypothetical protein [Flavisolibacter sp.]